MDDSEGMKDYGALMHWRAYGMLEQVFGAEWIALDAQGQKLVAQDFLDAANDDNVGAREYQRRIGAGNLASYADAMRVRARKGW